MVGVLAFVRFDGLVEIIKFARFDSIGAVFQAFDEVCQFLHVAVALFLERL